MARSRQYQRVHRARSTRSGARIRCLGLFTNLRFLETDSDQILCYAKATPDSGNIILVAVNLDPAEPHYCTAVVPPEAVGVAPGQSYGVTDLLTGSSWTWGERNYVRLDPAVEPAHILLVAKAS